MRLDFAMWINSTRGRFQSNIAEKLTKLMIFPLAVCPQGGQGCQKNEKNPQNSNFWVLRALILKRPDIVTPKPLAECEFGSTTKTTLQGDEFGHII